jgi:hypothetical protein
MSEDEEKTTNEIMGLAKTLATAHVEFINEHHNIGNAAVMTAASLFVAIIVDSLSFDDDDPSEEEVMTTLTEAAMSMLGNRAIIRQFMTPIIDTVVGWDQ